jgi:hypothetical protein
MTDSEEAVPDRSRTALYSWEGLPGARSSSEVQIGSVTVTQPPEPETFTGDENITVTIPDVVGVDEACEILGVSREALDELRKSEPEDTFPVPTELQSGPVWDARWIRHYAAQRNRG